jgi:hypothetical protein
VNLAGEALSRRLVEGVYDLGTVKRVWNLYGPTEDTTYTTGVLVPRGVAQPPTMADRWPRPGCTCWMSDWSRWQWECAVNCM